MTVDQPDLLRAACTDPEALWLPEGDRVYVADEAVVNENERARGGQR